MAFSANRAPSAVNHVLFLCELRVLPCAVKELALFHFWHFGQ